MKTIRFIFVLIIIVSAIRSVNAQSGWVQAQLNTGIGYSLFANDSVVFASTYDGVFSTTGDGMPWFSKGPANHPVYSVILTDHSILAATADGIFRSTDKGNSWELIPGSPRCSGVGGIQGHQVFSKNGSFIFIHTWAQGLYRSDDDGKTWKLLSVGTRSGLSGDLGSWATSIYSFGGKIFITAPGDNIGIYYSSDNGDAWVPAKSTDSSGSDNLLFFYADHDTLYSGGFMGLYRSTDSGKNWVTQYQNVINPGGQVIGLGIFRDLVAYGHYLVAAVDAKSLQRSQDGGKNWTNFNDGLISDWSFADLAVKQPYIWALTKGFGNAYRCLLSEIVTDVKPDMKTPETQIYLGQNYPNPFRNTTKISYLVKKTGTISLEVFDVFGKKVVTLINEKQVPGTYELELNAQNLKSGTYFYRLNASDCTQTKKLEVFR